MRLITRLDLDGIACAVMISVAEGVGEIRFANPHDVENRMIEIDVGDIIAHLPLHPDARIWFFNHNASNVNPALLERVRGKFEEASSTARLVYNHYNSPKLTRYAKLVDEVDRISTVNLTKEDIASPKDWVLISYTLDPRFNLDEGYGMWIMGAIREGKSTDEILAFAPVKKRVDRYTRDEERYKTELNHYTVMHGNVIVTDFRDFDDPPHGNRFSAFVEYPDGCVHVRAEVIDIMRVKLSVSKSIFNRKCNVHIGNLMAEFGGGGIEGAGTCMLSKKTADERLAQIIERLK